MSPNHDDIDSNRLGMDEIDPDLAKKIKLSGAGDKLGEGKHLQRLVKAAINDLGDDVMDLVPRWREAKGRIFGESETEGNKDTDIPRIKVRLEITLSDEETKS